MNKRRPGFVFLDGVFLATAILPIVFGIVLKVLTTPISEGITITGARIFFSVDMPVQPLVITESQINSWIVIVSLLGLCLYLTHGLSVRHPTRRQHLAEWLVEKSEKLTLSNMGDDFSGFPPLIASIIGLSALSSLLSLFGLYPPTSDINVTAGWAVAVFVLITYYKFKCGPVHYLKSFGDPVPLLAPLNIISEVATPISMAFRHYGNVLSGAVISVLVATGLDGLWGIIMGWLPSPISELSLIRIGIPAVLSVYFDLFSGCLQAYIFAMLAMLYISSGYPRDEYLKRKNKKRINKKTA
ncbi:MAG: F0F1 ATP synthase subunit A [Clostridia bacterium]|nr:F0F1 ATP synthase subunit A [Clostridia bacterium]